PSCWSAISPSWAGSPAACSASMACRCRSRRRDAGAFVRWAAVPGASMRSCIPTSSRPWGADHGHGSPDMSASMDPVTPFAEAGDATAQPRPVLTRWHAVAIIVGIVVGAGILKAPAMGASFAGSPAWMFGAWVLGGLVSIVGALVYAELATACPHAGGDYHFLRRAYGRTVSFLFAWARLSVIATGSIVLLAFVFGDYMQELLPLGEAGPAWYAAA